ncbi:MULTISPECIES: glycosyltransferase family 2 protein [unclassified Bifidobacterium]|uniref:glycosyltransferase family 2 protein n=1 Tax=unclassified Bifidobacterium TaxID=2608897 RepID=UPI0021591FDF|nr:MULTISPECIES: glycosyltransferase family 2 protein [unclassified Bifidobacterium]
MSMSSGINARSKANRDEPLVSVIVPVYNVERYLDRCVTSIVNQTYRKLEIILVDDGSPDRCPEMCDEWARKDERIRVIHKKNGGLSSARNAALPVMKGMYLSFVDSDDFVDLNYIESAVRVALRDNAQIVFLSTVNDVVKENGDVKSASVQGTLEFTAQSRDEFIGRFLDLSDGQYVCPVWNKLFLAEFALQDAHRFDESVRVGEDSLFNFPLYARAERVSATHSAKYHYCIREQSGSLMSVYNPRMLRDRTYIHQTLLPIIQQWNPAYVNDHNNRLISNVWILLSLLYADHTSDVRIRRRQLTKAILMDPVVRTCAASVRLMGNQRRLVVVLVRSKSVVLTGMVMGAISKLKALRGRR